MTRLRVVLFGVLGFALFFVLWHFSRGLSIFERLPGPWDTLLALIETHEQGILWKAVVASVFRVSWGFLLAAAIGIPFGVALGWFVRLRATFNPVVQALRPCSPIAWLPFAVLMFGRVTFMEPADVEGVFIIFLASFFPIVTAATSAVSSVEQKYVRSAANFGVEGLQLFRRVILPAAMPQILTGLRLALGIAWVVVVAAEMLGVESGLGYQINDSRNNLRYDLVGAAMFVIAMIGLVLDSLMSRVERAALTRRGIHQK